jgi:hypothetical protein
MPSWHLVQPKALYDSARATPVDSAKVVSDVQTKELHFSS